MHLIVDLKFMGNKIMLKDPSVGQLIPNNQDQYHSYNLMGPRSWRWDDDRLVNQPRPNIKTFIPTTFGSADFASLHEIQCYGLTQQGQGRTLAPFVGTISNGSSPEASPRVFGRSPSSIELLSSNHSITIAKTQAGKSSGQLTINLLEYPGPTLVNDPKGELYSRTAGYRATELGHKVYRFAPEAEDTDVFNPLSAIRTDPNISYDKMTFEQKYIEEEDAKYLAELLITPSGNPEDVFWERLAQRIIVGLLLYTATAALTEELVVTLIGFDEDEEEKLRYLNLCRLRERSMYEVTRLLFLEPEAFKTLLELMSQSERSLIRNSATQYMRLEAGEGKIGQSIFAMLIGQLDVWTSQRIRRATYKPSAAPEAKRVLNDFEFTDLADGTTTIYINFPVDLLPDSNPVLRVLIGTAMRQLKLKNKLLVDSPSGHDKPPVLFLLDEFATLGYMRPIEDALTYIAGYNVRFWFFVQDISQLKLHYPKTWSTFFSNTGTQCFYGINDIDTAKLVSEKLGTATVENSAYNNGTSTGPGTWQGAGQRHNHSATTAYTARPLMTPDEIQRKSKDHAFIFVHGIKPILTRLTKYYEYPALVEKSKISPPRKEMDPENWTLA